MASEEGSGGKVIPVRVVVRVRPLSAKEIREGCQECVDITHDSPQVTFLSPFVCALVSGSFTLFKAQFFGFLYFHVVVYLPSCGFELVLCYCLQVYCHQTYLKAMDLFCTSSFTSFPTSG